MRGDEGAQVKKEPPVMLLDLLLRRCRGGGGGGSKRGMFVSEEPLCPLESDAGDAQIEAIGDELELEGDERPLMELERLLEVEPVDFAVPSEALCSVKSKRNVRAQVN